jgi:hypothetical protein
MFQQTHIAQCVDSSAIPTLYQWKALRLLNEAWLAAHSEGKDVWQFAVEIEQLRALGLSHTELRCLLCWDYLQHAQERTTVRTSQRIFQPLKALVLPKRTCFVLTTKGQEVASQSDTRLALGDGASPPGPTAALHSGEQSPHWDGEAGQLWWEKHLIKKFRRPAANQELVLAALEEEGWPPRIDDPLPPTGDIDPKARLHDTIKSLNRHHLHRVLYFAGDGKGRGIQWILLKGD